MARAASLCCASLCWCTAQAARIALKTIAARWTRTRSSHREDHSSHGMMVHLPQLLDLLPADRSGPVVVPPEDLLDQLLTQWLTVILGLHSLCSHESDFLSGLTGGPSS